MIYIACHPFCAPELHMLFSIFEGNVALSRQDFKRSSKGCKIEFPQTFSIRILILPCPWALFGSRFYIILAISALVTGTDERALVAFILSVA